MRVFPRRELVLVSRSSLWLALGVLLTGFSMRPAVASTSPSALEAVILQEELSIPSSLELSSADDRISFFVEGDLDASAVASHGGEASSITGGLHIVRVSPNALSGLLKALPNLQVRPAHWLTPQLNVSVPEIGADDLWGGPSPNYTGFAGKNVIVGIVDTGVDLTHQDFANPSTGKTRILNLWDQTAAAVNPPSGFTYGRLWSNTEIDAGQCTETDGNGHGTFLASIAAGNGKATGNGKSPYRYVGVAPEADLVIVKTRGQSTDIVDGVKYVFQRATQLGKDAVACIAFGTQAGPHDGTDPMEASLNALTGPGRIICAAAGNDGANPIHASTSVTTTGGSVSFQVPTHSTGGFQRVLIEGWYPQSKNLTISAKSPSGITIGPITRGNYIDTNTSEGTVTLYNGMVTNSRGDYQITVNVRNSASDLAAGIWTVQLTTSTAPAPVDFWITSYYFLSPSAPAMVGGMNFDRTIMTPATAEAVLSAGAYCTKPNWVAQNGTTYGLGGAVMNNIASWSSRGPSRDGRFLPDICASGFGVGAALSRTCAISSMFILDDGVHAIRQGTSAGAAHLTGSVALLLQEERSSTGGTLNPAEVRALLRQNARADTYTGLPPANLPNNTWGYGKLSLAVAQVGVEGSAAARLGFAHPYPNPARNLATFEFAVSSADLQTGKIELQIADPRGRLVSSLRGAPVAGLQRVAWNLTDSRGRRVAPGVYLAKLVVGNLASIRKVAVLNP